MKIITGLDAASYQQALEVKTILDELKAEIDMINRALRNLRIRQEAIHEKVDILFTKNGY